MKTNPTLNKIDKNFTSYLSRCIILIFVLNTSIVLGQSNACNADLKVEKNRITRSTLPEGTYYSMVITNNGKTADTFSLSSLNVNTTCSNPDGSKTAKNVTLNVEFLDKKLKPINDIKINPGETFSFLAHITVPNGTSLDKWSCTEVIAKSRLCPNYKVDTVLHTLVINPNEDK